MTLQRGNILVIGAHYDDAELGAGGSMAKWVKEGNKVFKLTLSDNDTRFKDKKIYVKPHEAKSESKKACEILGVEELNDLVLPQKCTELVYNKRDMQKIEAFILDRQINMIVMHNIFDIQQDHVHAATISYVAGRYCDSVLMYQSNQYVLPVDFYPRYYVDISKTIDLKKRH